MQKLLVLLFTLFSQLSYANCDKFLSERLQDMNMGTLNQPNCATIKSETSEKTRISLSKVKGKNDLGPTLSMYKSDPSNIKMVQLYSKDNLSKHRHKYQYVLGSGCNEVKKVIYTLGTLQSEVNEEKCREFEESFKDLEKSALNVYKICTNYFPEVQNSENDKIKKSSSVIME